MMISEAARRSGVSAHALRHYERLGLICARRRASGYREYGEQVVRDVAFIVAGRKLGFSLKDLREALPAFRVGRLTPAQGISALNERIAALDRQLADLRAQRRVLLGHLQRLQQRNEEPR